MITRGTTPPVTIELPFDAAELVDGEIRFAQAGELLFVRSLDDCEASGNYLTLYLTEDETLSLSALAVVEAQIIATNTAGVKIASEVMEADVGRLLGV